MENSRTINSIKNFKSSLILQIINKIMSFVVRTIFIKTLNNEYLGVNGLFVDILALLSFAELGIGTAIIYSMYKPIAENDIGKLKSLMKLYKRCYFAIGVVIFLVGLCIVPFLGFIVKSVPNIYESIELIYVLFLFDTSISYFFIYKKSIIIAYQQEREVNKINSFIVFVKSLLQILVLVFTKNFIFYLFTSIICTFLQNYFTSMKADKMFPFLKEKNVSELSIEEKKNIFDNVKSLFVYKVGNIILNGTDNIIMSSMINVVAVGLCSNYSLIINAIKSIVSGALNSVTASIGNLNATSEKKRKEKIFNELTLINYFVYSFVAVGFIVLLNPLINIWLGKKYILDFSIIIAMSFAFFIEGIRLPAYTYRTTLGLFEKGRMTPFIATIVNIVSSIVLCYYLGVLGIFIGTCLAQLSSYSWIDAYLIYKYEFKKNVKMYYLKLMRYYVYFIICIFVTLGLSNLFVFSGIFGFFVKLLFVLFVPIIINCLLLHNDIEYISVTEKFVRPFFNRIKKS